MLAARYQIALKGEQVSGLADYETQSFTDDWTVIPLLGAQTQIEEIEPAEAQVIAREGHFVLVTNRAGKQKIRIKFAARLTGGIEGAHLQMTIVPAAITTLSVAG